jgi:hypothetical protein
LLVIVAAHSLVSFVFLHSDEISLFKVAAGVNFEVMYSQNCFGLFKDGDAGIGVFPRREEMVGDAPSLGQRRAAFSTGACSASDCR